MAKNINRRGVELEYAFLGRPVRPFHLAVTISSFSLGALNLFFESTPLSRTPFGDLVGVIGIVSGLLLLLGWWFRKDRLGEWGLLIACGMWIQRMIFYGLLPEFAGERFTFPVYTELISLAWAVGCGGAWMLERADYHGGRE